MMSQKLLERFLHGEETGVAARILTYSDPGGQVCSEQAPLAGEERE